jgi:NAD(P)-dependent dehydrogenase (short-subunit alcohol dehydrogenase family)
LERIYGVTGVARGIGASLARQLKAAGHYVVGFDISETNQNIDCFIRLDLNEASSIESAVAGLDMSLDGLCNNAGLPPRDGLEAMLLQVNFLGTRHFTDRMIPKLKPGASIVNIASRAGAAWRESLEQVLRLGAITDRGQLVEFIATEALDPTRCYNLSKEAVIVWTAALTEDLIKRDLRANTLSPGAVATSILDDFARAFGEKMARNVVRAGRAGTSDEIAAIAAFLLSPESSWIKGIDIPIDGGMGSFNMSDMLGLDAMKLIGASTGTPATRGTQS